MSEDLKAELKAKLEAKGVEVDYRWGVPKMESVLAAMAIADEQEPEETVLVTEDPEGELEGDETLLLEDEPEEAPEPAPEQPDGTLRCRVTKKGHNKIFTGKEDPKYFIWNPDNPEDIYLPPEGARQLEDRGFVEILDEPITE